MLNEEAYYNRTNGKCPKSHHNSTEDCDFTSIGLTEDAKGMISESVWNLGGSNTSSIISKEFYERERGSDVYSKYKTKWTGQVGLIYPSDYGYATAGDATTDRSTCLNTSLSDWNGSNVEDCKTNDWLYKNSEDQWTMARNPSDPTQIFALYSTGQEYFNRAFNECEIRPSVYLNLNTGIKIGEVGSSTSPFVLKK